MISWLMRRVCAEGHWGSAQHNCWAALALDAYLRAFDPADHVHEAEAWLGCAAVLTRAQPPPLRFTVALQRSTEYGGKFALGGSGPELVTLSVPMLELSGVCAARDVSVLRV